MNYTRVFAEVDLSAIKENMESMKKNLEPGTEMIGVVKADGYGHGSVPVAKAIAPYVWGYACATVEEAVVLRNHGISKPVMILGQVHPSSYETILKYELQPPVFQLEKAKKLSEMAVDSGKQVDIHLVLDTGMNRIGMKPGKAALEEVQQICALPGIVIQGMFTHFAKADEKEKSSARKQLERYCKFAEALEERGIRIPRKHCSNSAAISDLREAHLDLVRAGISIYGLYPSSEVEKDRVLLRPALSLRSAVSYVKQIGPGEEISYGGTFVSVDHMTVATIPIGYGDGYSRNLSGVGYVLIHGRKAPILGRVCMDQMMVDVTDIPDVREDDPVTLIGRDGEEQITVEQLAELSGGFHYEILCDIGKRVPRVYLEDGVIVGTKDYFQDEYNDFKA